MGGLDQKGFTPRSRLKRSYISWRRLDKKIQETVFSDKCESINCFDYDLDYARTTRSNLSKATVVEPLIDGPESFKMREELIKNAKQSILISTWAIYDDETGFTLQKQLLSAIEKNPNIEIKLIVDGQVSKRDHHFAVLEGLEKQSNGKIEILYWRSSRYRANGNHRKFIVIDKSHLILGGTNFGNVYSHLMTKDKWRDTDLYAQGGVAIDSYNLFASIWNEQLRTNKKAKSLTKMDKEVVSISNGSISTILNDHSPGTNHTRPDRNILTGIVKLIDEASESIDIENAYFILTKPIKSALNRALSRGVQVRILTNSEQSVDEPVVSYPIVSSALKMADLGAKVYLRKGTTLHSKFMIIDSSISMVGSYNLHPRSYRYEGETVLTVVDKNFSEKLKKSFVKDISEKNALLVRSSSQVEVKDSFLAKLARTLFFNQL